VRGAQVSVGSIEEASVCSYMAVKGHPDQEFNGLWTLGASWGNEPHYTKPGGPSGTLHLYYYHGEMDEAWSVAGWWCVCGPRKGHALWHESRVLTADCCVLARQGWGGTWNFDFRDQDSFDTFRLDSAGMWNWNSGGYMVCDRKRCLHRKRAALFCIVRRGPGRRVE